MVKGIVTIYDTKGMTQVRGFTSAHGIICKRKMRNYCKNYLLTIQKRDIRVLYTKTELMK